MDMRIASIEGSEVLGSRGNPTAAVEVTLACEVTDGDTRYHLRW